MHTPGPWKVELDELGCPIVRSPAYQVASVMWCGFTMGDWHKGGPSAEAKRLEITSNARLIAVAPDLLAALRDARESSAALLRAIARAGVVNEVDAALDRKIDGFGVRMQDAIAKAEGRI